MGFLIHALSNFKISIIMYHDNMYYQISQILSNENKNNLFYHVKKWWHDKIYKFY